jgi:putative ABC transport system substrate-binding protein
MQLMLNLRPHPPCRPGIDRRRFLVTSLAGAIVAPLAGEAQRRQEVRRIGYLHADLGGLPVGFYEILRDGLRDFGYLEGRNLIIEHRFGDSLARLDELAAELVRLNVEVIVTPGAATDKRRRDRPPSRCP